MKALKKYGVGSFWLLYSSICSLYAQSTPIIQWEMFSSPSFYAFHEDLCASPDGGLLVIGGAVPQDSGFVDPNIAVFDFWAMKIDSSKNIEWEINFGHPGEYEFLEEALFIESDTSFILAGFRGVQLVNLPGGSARQYKNLFIVKIDSQGDTIWTKTIPNLCDNVTSIYLTQTNNSGFALTVGNLINATWDMNRARVINFDQDGNIIWETFVGDAPFEPRGINFTIDGKYIVSGISVVSSAHPNFLDLYIEKLDGSGNSQWYRYYSNLIQPIGMGQFDNGKIITWGRSDELGGDYNRVNLISFTGQLEEELNFNGSGTNQIWSALPIDNNYFIGTGVSDSPEFCENCEHPKGWIFKSDIAGNIQWSLSPNAAGTVKRITEVVESKPGVYYYLGLRVPGFYNLWIGRLIDPNELEPLSILGPSDLCTLTDNSFSSNYPTSVSHTWELTFRNLSGDTILVQEIMDTNAISTYFSEPGYLELCVAIFDQITACRSVLVGEDNVTEVSSLLCPGNCLIVNDSTQYCESGIYVATLLNELSCDSTVIYTVQVLPNLVILDTTIVVDSLTNSGSIFIQVTGGLSPYSYFWSNGETSSSISNLSSGYYTVTVVDGNGCQIQEEFYVPLVTSSQSVAEYSGIDLFPNPVTREQELTIKTSDSIVFKSMKYIDIVTGYSQEAQSLYNDTFFAPQHPGVYIVNILTTGGQIMIKKIIVI